MESLFGRVIAPLSMTLQSIYSYLLAKLLSLSYIFFMSTSFASTSSTLHPVVSTCSSSLNPKVFYHRVSFSLCKTFISSFIFLVRPLTHALSSATVLPFCKIAPQRPFLILYSLRQHGSRHTRTTFMLLRIQKIINPTDSANIWAWNFDLLRRHFSLLRLGCEQPSSIRFPNVFDRPWIKLVFKCRI